MESQKLKNKQIIGFIYWLLTALLGLGGIIILFSLVLFALTLFNPDFDPFIPVIDIPLKISENALLEFNDGTQTNILVDNIFVSFNIDQKYGLSGVLNYLLFISILVIAYYIIFLLWKIFKSIRKSLISNNPFYYKNVWRIRLIAFMVLFSAIIQIAYPLIMKYLWFNKIIMFDKALDVKLNFDGSINIFWGLIILVVAEVYRIGLEIKKDQELTI